MSPEQVRAELVETRGLVSNRATRSPSIALSLVLSLSIALSSHLSFPLPLSLSLLVSLFLCACPFTLLFYISLNAIPFFRSPSHLPISFPYPLSLPPFLPGLSSPDQAFPDGATVPVRGAVVLCYGSLSVCRAGTSLSNSSLRDTLVFSDSPPLLSSVSASRGQQVMPALR